MLKSRKINDVGNKAMELIFNVKHTANDRGAPAKRKNEKDILLYLALIKKTSLNYRKIYKLLSLQRSESFKAIKSRCFLMKVTVKYYGTQINKKSKTKQIKRKIIPKRIITKKNVTII